MRYIAPKILNVVNAKAAIQTAKESSPISDGVPHLTAAPAYQADE